jgi:hypothetical protein
MKTRALLLLIPAAILLSGCEETDRANALLANPETIDIGTFDGCTVKYVNRGWKDQSFYLARCDHTASQTMHWDERHGKSTVQRQSLVISQEIEKLQAEKDAAETKEKAIAKLSPEERKVLGIDK